MAFVVVSAAALWACGDDGPSAARPPAGAIVDDAQIGPVVVPVTVAPNGESIVVQSLDNSFRPETLTITAGTEVVWRNVGRNEHNVVPVDGAGWGVVDPAEFAPGGESRHVFGVAGEFAYYCTIHGTATAGMIGTVVVTAPT
jgi:plastocyanin